MGNLFTSFQLTGQVRSENPESTLLSILAKGYIRPLGSVASSVPSPPDINDSARLQATLTLTSRETFQAVADLVTRNGASTWHFDILGSGYVLENHVKHLPSWVWMSRCTNHDQPTPFHALVMASQLSLDFTTRTCELIAVVFGTLNEWSKEQPS